MKKLHLIALVMFLGVAFLIPSVTKASILKSQLVADQTYYYRYTDLFFSQRHLYQGLGNSVGGAITSLGVYMSTSTNVYGSSYIGLDAIIMTCTGNSTTTGCTEYTSSNRVPSYSTDTIGLVTFNWNTAVNTSGKYVFLKLLQSDWNGDSAKYMGSVSDVAYSYCGTNTLLCKNWYTSGPIEDLFYIVAGEDEARMNYPVSGLYAKPRFEDWGVYIPARYSSSTVNIKVDYGQATGNYIYQDSDINYFPASNGGYNSVKVSPVDDIERDLKFSLGVSAIPRTWYARAKLYMDFDRDGVYDDLMATTNEISFIYYPDSVLFSGLKLGTSTQGAVVEVQTFGTSTCPQGVICTSANGTKFYIDQNGNVQTEIGTTTIDYTPFGNIYREWQNLMNKPPFGYFTVLKNVYLTVASSTATTSIYAGIDVTGFNDLQYAFPFLGTFRALESALLWGAVGFYLIRKSINLTA